MNEKLFETIYTTEQGAKTLIEKEIDILLWSSELQNIKWIDALNSYIEKWIFTEWTNFIRLYEQNIDLLKKQ